MIWLTIYTTPIVTCYSQGSVDGHHSLPRSIHILNMCQRSRIVLMLQSQRFSSIIALHAAARSLMYTHHHQVAHNWPRLDLFHEVGGASHIVTNRVYLTVLHNDERMRPTDINLPLANPEVITSWRLIANSTGKTQEKWRNYCRLLQWEKTQAAQHIWLETSMTSIVDS